MKRRKKRHKHYWHFEHLVWQGRRENECAIGRFCACGVKQMAFASGWRAVLRSYTDMDEKLQDGIDYFTKRRQ